MGGKLFGNGTVTGALSNSAGTITPGISSSVTGVLTDKGAYSQGSSGLLDISIGGTAVGTQFGQLNPTTAALNGTLDVGLINGFVPTIGQTFKIMNFSSETGTFTHCTCEINSSEHFAISYQATDVLLMVVAGGGGNFSLPLPLRDGLRLTSPSDLRAASGATSMQADLGNAQLHALPAGPDAGRTFAGPEAARGARSSRTAFGNAVGARQANALGPRSRSVVAGLSWRWSLANLLSKPVPELAVH